MLESSQVALVVGGAGFIGSRLVKELLRRGWRVRVIGRNAVAGRFEAVEYIQCGVTDQVMLSRAVAGAGVVFCLSKGGGPRWEDFERDCVAGAENLAVASLNHGRPRIVFASSIAAIYLGSEGEVDEATAPDSRSKTRSFYSRAKALAEQTLLRYHKTHSLPVVILRPGIVLGDRNAWNHSGFGEWINNITCYGWGRGNSKLPLVLVSDVVTAFADAGTAPNIEGRCFNLAGDVLLTAQEFLAHLSSATGRRFAFLPRSCAGIYSIHLLNALLKWILGQQFRSLSCREIRSRAQRSVINCNAAKAALGWEPNRDLERFLSESIYQNTNQVEREHLRRLKS